MLVSAQQTVNILSILATPRSPLCFSKLIAIGPFRIRYLFFSKPITFSTWILTRDNCLDSSTSLWLSCCLPRVNAGISSFVPWMARSSAMVNPQSANIVSPCSTRLKKLHSCVKFLSDTLPPQHSDRKHRTEGCDAD